MSKRGNIQMNILLCSAPAVQVGMEIVSDFEEASHRANRYSQILITQCFHSDTSLGFNLNSITGQGLIKFARRSWTELGVPGIWTTC